VLAHDHPQVTVEHEDGLVFAVVDVHRAAVPAPVEVVGQGEGACGLLAAEAHLRQGAQEPDGRLGAGAGDDGARHGGGEAGHGRAPSWACGPWLGAAPGVSANRPGSIMSKADLVLIDNLIAWMLMRGCGGRSP